jgi:hypothetical protein
MTDVISLVFDFINGLLGGAPTGQAIPNFSPFYNLLVILWMAAISSLFVAIFWKKFRSFAAFLIWIAIFLTLIQQGSSTNEVQVNQASGLFNISFSTVVIIVLFVIVTLLIFGKMLGGKRSLPTPG